MSTIEKLIERMLTRPRDFEVSELDRIFKHFGYKRYNAKGSGIKYVRPDGRLINFHSPHGTIEHSVKRYVLDEAIDELKKWGHIK